MCVWCAEYIRPLWVFENKIEFIVCALDKRAQCTLIYDASCWIDQTIQAPFVCAFLSRLARVSQRARTRFIFRDMCAVVRGDIIPNRNPFDCDGGRAARALSMRTNLKCKARQACTHDPIGDDDVSSCPRDAHTHIIRMCVCVLTIAEYLRARVRVNVADLI